MNLDEEKLCTKVVELDMIYKFAVDKFFILELFRVLKIRLKFLDFAI